MSFPKLEIPEDLPIDDAFVKKTEIELEKVGKDLASNKMKEMHLLQESAANGGPSSPQEAIVVAMDYCGVGIRSLAQYAGVSRTKLKRMIDGQIAMPPEVLDKCCELFHRKKPDIFSA